MAKERKTGRAQVGLRVSGDMQRRLERAAKKNGRSINSEIIERLERSFEFEDRLGGPKVAELVETIGTVMRSTGEHAAFFVDSSKTHDQGEWLAVPYAFDQARKAANTILDYHRPKGPIVPPKVSPNDLAALARKTKTDSKDITALVIKMFKEFGELTAGVELRKRGQDDE